MRNDSSGRFGLGRPQGGAGRSRSASARIGRRGDMADDRSGIVIDVHWHHVPGRLATAVLEGRCRVDGVVSSSGGVPEIKMTNGFLQDLPPDLIDPDLIVTALDNAGVDRVGASLAPPLSHHDSDPQIALEVSRFANDGFAELAEATRGRIIPLANLPVGDVGLAIGEIRRVVEELGFKGVAIGSNVSGRNLGDESLLPFWEEVRNRDLFVFVHGISPLGRDRLKAHQLGNLVGLPIDTAVAVGSMIFGGVFDRFPGLKVCFSHGGGAFPCLLGRWDHGYRARLLPKGATIGVPSTYLTDIYCDSLTHDAATLRYLVERVGAGHVLLGSDFPFDMGEPDPVGKVKAAIADEAVVRQILGETAARLLGV
jgi:aminocarboxymuconate-semialdehyde decarboxylase